MKEYGINPSTTLEKGLSKTINWFKDNYDSENIRL